MEEREIWANAVLKDGKLIFWWTGSSECHDIYDFNKDFYCAGLKMMEELKNFNYELKAQRVESFEKDKEFYKQFELHENFKGKKPY